MFNTGTHLFDLLISMDIHVYYIENYNATDGKTDLAQDSNWQSATLLLKN